MNVYKNGMIYLFGDVLIKLIPFLMIPYLTRSFGLNGYADIAIYMSILALLDIVFNFGQSSALVRYSKRYGDHGIPTIKLVGIFISAVMFIFVQLLALFFENDLIVVLSIVSMLNVIFSNMTSLYIIDGKPVVYTFFHLLSSLFTSLGIILLIENFGNEVEYRFYPIIVANIIVLFIGKSYFKFSLKYFKHFLKYIVSYGSPLVFHSFAFFLKGNFDRIYLDGVLNKELLAQYVIAFQLSGVVLVILQALNKSFIPWFYDFFKNDFNNKAFIKYVKWSLLIPLIFTLLFALIPENVFSFYIGSDVPKIKNMTIIFVFSNLIMAPYFILVSFFMYHGKTKVLSAINLLSALIYVVFLVFISAYNPEYAPFSLLFSNFVLVLSLFLYYVYYSSGAVKNE